MFDTYLTVIGNVVSPPRMRLTKSGHSVTNFRIASTSRRFDSEKGTYVDNSTLFVNVTCWRGLAENVASSILKGQPVVVSGRYFQRDYTVNETVRVAYELEAVAVGHDLSRGHQRLPEDEPPERCAAHGAGRRGHPRRRQRPLGGCRDRRGRRAGRDRA